MHQLFEKIVATNSCQKFLEISNKAIGNFEIIIRQTVLNTVNAGEYNYDKNKKIFETIIANISAGIKTNNISGMKHKRLQELISTMQDAVNHLEKTKKN